jgi:hypothetical protein
LRRLARDRIAFRQWTEDPTLQGNRDRWWRRRYTVLSLISWSMILALMRTRCQPHDYHDWDICGLLQNFKVNAKMVPHVRQFGHQSSCHWMYVQQNFFNSAPMVPDSCRIIRHYGLSNSTYNDQTYYRDLLLLRLYLGCIANQRSIRFRCMFQLLLQKH